MARMSHGSCTLFALANDGLTIGWGQGAAYGELAAGVGQPKSATKPQTIECVRA